MTTSTPTTVWPKAKLQGGNTAPPISRKLDQRFTDHGPSHQSKTQFYPSPVPTTRKIPKASYPHVTEGRQNEKHNHRKLNKLITWITILTQ